LVRKNEFEHEEVYELIIIGDSQEVVGNISFGEASKLHVYAGKLIANRHGQEDSPAQRRRAGNMSHPVQGTYEDHGYWYVHLKAGVHIPRPGRLAPGSPSPSQDRGEARTRSAEPSPGTIRTAATSRQARSTPLCSFRLGIKRQCIGIKKRRMSTRRTGQLR
jgi:hypothetical protein